MRKAYLLVYNDAAGSREKIKKWANDSPNILTWRFDLPNCFYLISELSADEISGDLAKTVGVGGRWLVLEIVENRQGRLPLESWYLMRNKQRKPK